MYDYIYLIPNLESLTTCNIQTKCPYYSKSQIFTWSLEYFVRVGFKTTTLFSVSAVKTFT